MDPCAAIRFLMGSPVRPKVLRSTSEPATVTDLATALPHSKRAISDAIEWFEHQGWLKEVEDGHVQTLIGAAVLHQIDEQRTRGESVTHGVASAEKTNGESICKEETKRADLQFIVGSRLRERMLRSDSLPMGSSKLAARYETTASTAYRTITSLEEKGWFEKGDGAYHRTSSGQLAFQEFETLRRVIEQAFDKKECLRWLNRDLADLPVENLASAQTAVNTRDHTDTTEELFGEVVQTEFDRYRGMITYVNNSAARKFSPQIQDTAHSELLVTPSVMKNLPTAGKPAEMVRNGLEATNFETLIAPQLPASLSIFDDDIIFICPRPEDIQGDEFGAIVSANEQVVEWAIDLYETYHDQSRRPPEHLIHALLERLDPSRRLDDLLND